MIERNENEYTEDGSCPYCKGDTFTNDAIEQDDGSVVNICYDCEKPSVWFDNKQYKVKE